MNCDLTSANNKDLVIIGHHVVNTHRENFILRYNDLTQQGLTQAVFDISITILETPT